MLSNRVAGGFLKTIEDSLDDPKAEGALVADKEVLHQLQADIETLGFFGALVMASNATPPDASVFDELTSAIRARLFEALGEHAKPDDSLVDLLAAHKAQSNAEQTACRLIAEAVHSHFELDQHSLFVEDVERALQLTRVAGGAAEDTKSFVRQCSRLSAMSAAYIVGLFPGHIELIFAIKKREADPKTIDAVFDSFAPPAIWKRLGAITKAMIQKEKRFRLAVTLWARLHGVNFDGGNLTPLEAMIEVKSAASILESALGNTTMRDGLRAFHAEHAATLRALLRAFV